MSILRDFWNYVVGTPPSDLTAQDDEQLAQDEPQVPRVGLPPQCGRVDRVVQLQPARLAVPLAHGPPVAQPGVGQGRPRRGKAD